MNLEQSIMQIPITDIIPNRFQPRLNFDDRGLEELANSIKQHGIIQPLVLRRINDKYEIIAGERRYKAATIAGLAKVPAIIAQVDDKQSAEVAIVENVQRRNLTPIEEARSYKNLLDKGYLTQAELAKKMGLSQSAIANKLRLLNLDEEVQEALLNNKISERHARSLLVLPTKEDQKIWLKKIINDRLTVRQLDEALKLELNKYKSEIKEEPSDEDEGDIPLVKSLDIDAIRKEATALPKIDEDSEIARRLREIEIEKKYNPEVIPVEQARNDAKGNFFNFLENETVNMNMDEMNLKAPAIDIDLPLPKKQPEKSDFPDAPKEANISNNFKATSSYEDTDFDPISLIDTLDPNYEKQEETKREINLKEAINEIRDTKDILSSKGFNINMEETDSNDYYQFTIKIKKD